MRKSITILVGIFAVAALAQLASALTVNPVIKDIGGTPASNLSVQDPFSAARVSFENNAVEKISIGGITADGGVSITLAVSNGENGMNVGAGSGPGGIGANNDAVNTSPVGTAIDIANGGNGTQGHRIQNGNAFRFSLWMQQVPGDPITQAISVEPVLKFELFSEAQSVFADYDGRKPTAAFGDRLWDTDLNATDSIFEGQSVASHVDIDGDNAVVTGDEPVASLPEATGAQWVRVETTIVIDDDPDGTGFGWDIAGQAFGVSAIEEVRGTFFIGDFTGAVLGPGGSVYIDNALLEVFANEAEMLATPNPNPLPIAALVGDYNDDGSVNAADYTVWRDNLGGPASALKNRSPSVTGFVKTADYTIWKTNFGQGGSGALSAGIVGYAPGQSVPEPGTIVLCFLASVGAACIRRHHR